MTRRRGWRDFARCAETDPEVFFGEFGVKYEAARAICGGCEVQADCLDYALENDERYGVWGGTTEMERRVLRRDYRAGRRSR